MKRIWNTFCEDISKNKGVKEMTFEKEIVKSFLQALGWSRYDGNLEEQYGLYSRKWIPDFVFYLNNDKNAKEIILELKKPDHKQRKVDIEQIEAYMKLTDCRFGLYFGEKLEQFCLDNIYLNTFLRHCKHQGGQQQLYDCIMERFILPESMACSLRSRLKFTIVDNPESEEKSTSPTTVIPTAPQVQNGKGNVWLICYDNEGFDVEKCFKKLGQVYWKHKKSLVNVQKGDVAYLYANAPKSAVRFRVEIVESHLPYSPIMDEEDEFLKSGTSNREDAKYKYFLVRPLAETNSPVLKHTVLMSKGLMGKRPTTTILSKEEYKSLLEYIEQHFDEIK